MPMHPVLSAPGYLCMSSTSALQGIRLHWWFEHNHGMALWQIPSVLTLRVQAWALRYAGEIHWGCEDLTMQESV